MFLFLAYGMLSCRWRNRKKCFLRRLTVCVCLLARKLLFIHVKMADVACPLLYLSLLKVVGKEYPGLNLSNGVISLCGIHTASCLVRELVSGIAISELIFQPRDSGLICHIYQYYSSQPVAFTIFHLIK